MSSSFVTAGKAIYPPQGSSTSAGSRPLPHPRTASGRRNGLPAFGRCSSGCTGRAFPSAMKSCAAAHSALPEGAPGPEQLLETYVARLGDRPQIRAPLEIILAEARRNVAPDDLPSHVRQAYLDLNEALGLGSEGVDAPPDADRAAFDPDEAYDAGNQESASFGSDFNLGGILGPLRQLSYWTMKNRARTVGDV